MNVKHIAVGLLGYYIFGKFGLSLAIPPGFASSIWPAAGFAFATAMLLHQRSIILGVAIGTFILNLEVASQGFSSLSWNQVTVPFFIALGAIIQLRALLYGYNKLIQNKVLPDQTRDILFLALVVAPISCIFGASFGTGALLVNQIIPAEATFFTWFTWWTGNTIGVLLFTPLLLVLFNRSNQFNAHRKLQITGPVLIVFSLILLLFFNSIKSHEEDIYREAQDTTERFFVAIEKEFELALSMLTAFEGLYVSSTDVTAAEFARFSERILANNDILYAVGWTEIVNLEEREKYETTIASQGFPGFTFTEFGTDGSLVTAGPRDKYYPVLFIYPYQKNARAHGLDLGHNKSRLNTLLSALKTGERSSTPPITLAQELGNNKAFIVYQPVYSDQNERSEENLTGFVSGVFRASSMFQDLVSQATTAGFSMSIIDETGTQPVSLRNHTRSVSDNALRFSSILGVGGRQYNVEFALTDQQAFGKDWTSWWVMTAGVLFAVLLQSLILIITGSVSATERRVKEKTAELAEALEKADRANESKRNFLSNISHELRTPLNAIINLIRIAIKDTTENKTKDRLENANLASESLLNLINNTLDFNKIESGEFVLENREFDFQKLMKKVCIIFSSKAEAKAISFEVQSPTKLPTKIVGDSLRLEEVLLNLCSNAIKFTEQGRVSLELRSIQNPEDKKNRITIEFSISDTGVGISEEAKSRLFQPFQQGDESTTRKYGGTGLGLSISQSIVTLMGGQISVESNQGSGSTFSFSVSVALPDDPCFLDQDEFFGHQAGDWNLNKHIDTAEPSKDLDDHTSAAETNQNLPLEATCILVVDDVEVNQEIARHFLESAGATVMVANNGKQAVEMIHNNSHPEIELILMDIQMPEMDGYEATKLLREQFDQNQLPIIAMTANAMQPDIEKCMAAGMNDHIGKPVEESVMISRIVDCLKV
jgi:signal transduction histidine kinase/ActR/RegA family two-component response regulator